MRIVDTITIMDNSWLRVPIGPEAARWNTYAPIRTALVVVRTATTVAWLFDILPELLGDRRVQVVFTVNGRGSAFEPGVVQTVEELGGKLVPWAQATSSQFSVALSASYQGGLDELHAPLLIVPHGPGYTKNFGLPQPDAKLISQADQATHPRTTIALTHEDQRAPWRNFENDIVRTVVVGDPCIDQLRVSTSQVERYRRALGVLPDQRLIVVSTTWGPESLTATHPQLLERLLAEVPMDQYVVAAIFHPNVWVGHGAWQLRAWLRRAIQGGLRLVPYISGWRGTIVAADCLIGDHGSVTFYGATLGVPTLLGTFGHSELIPTTPLAELGRRAPALDAGTSLRPQIESMGFDRNPGRYSDLANQTFAHPGQAIDRLRAAIYDLMDLTAPAGCAPVFAVPEPLPESQPVWALRVTVKTVLSATEMPHRQLVTERFPACLDSDPERPNEHIAAEVNEPDHRLRETASVIVRSAPQPGDMNAAEWRLGWLESVLTQHPGCRVAGLGISTTSAILAVWNGPLLDVVVDIPFHEWVSCAGSAVYHLLTNEHLDFSSEMRIVVRRGSSSSGPGPISLVVRRLPVP